MRNKVLFERAELVWSVVREHTHIPIKDIQHYLAGDYGVNLNYSQIRAAIDYSRSEKFDSSRRVMNTAFGVDYAYYAMEQGDNLGSEAKVIIDTGITDDIQHILTRIQRVKEAEELVLTAINLLPNDRAWKEQLIFLVGQSGQSMSQALKVAKHMRDSGDHKEAA